MHTRLPRTSCSFGRLTAGVVCGLAAVLLAAESVLACAVPVFRYALERDSWHPAAYSVFLFHRGDLDADEREVLGLLEDAGRMDAEFPANVAVLAVNVEEALPAPLEPLWRQLEAEPLPRLAVTLPGRMRLMWTAEATPEAGAALLDSPARRKIQRRIADGDAAVWIVLESGDTDKDDAAAETIRRATGKFAEAFRFSPEATEAMALTSAEEARIAFSQIRVSRTDPEEAVLRDMLLSTEPDLHTFAEPMAFAVFGRGRTLWALVGQGISPGTVRSACVYITGDCSCEIKADNPGADLLFSADWYKVLAGVGPPSLSPSQADPAALAVVPAVPGGSNTVTVLLITGGVLLLVVSAGSLILRRSTPRGG